MKGYFFSQLKKDNYGPRRKVHAQVAAFCESGLDTELVEAPFVENGPIRGNFFLRQIISRLPFTYIYSKYIWDERFIDADFYYFRGMIGDWHFIRFLKRLRNTNPDARIVIEFADFPATFFMTISLFHKIVYFPDILKDYFAHIQYYKYVDRVAMLEDRKEVYGIPVIRFMNGIDINKIKKKRTAGTDIIKIIAVAAMNSFHGYERVIEGLYEYYQRGGDREIEFHLVGGDDKAVTEIPKYKMLVNRYKLENIVFFYGVKQGDELDNIYDKCNIALGSLAMFRLGYFDQVSSLKTREYLAKGLPIMAGNKIDVIEDDFPYFRRLSNDDSSIDMQRIIDFYDYVYGDKTEKDVIDIIRAYADTHCDMSATMQDVIHYLRGDK